MSNEIKYMTCAQIRDSFLDFFEGKGCKRYPSSSLIPDDPSLLLSNAGMNQFKEYYQGLRTMPEIGACSCQKCLRTNDIDNIGDSRHLSFFEMLGNFAFGGYTKEDAIRWAQEFCTSPEYLGLPMERLYFTVFRDDDESIELWQKYGADPSHITRLGEEDNFWAAGPTGPCGPCSEIYFDQGEEYGCGSPTCAPGCDCDRYLEFWNLVFTQYDRQEDGSMPDLPHRNVDTGMGLERITAIMQGQHSNYEGDVLRGLLAVGERLSGKTYHGEAVGDDRSLRIMADHSRAVTFMIGDGILPSNEGRGYILRRLLRRAIYHGRLLGIDHAFMVEYAHEVTRVMGDVYPALTQNAALIDGIISAEEERFNATLDKGEELLDAEIKKLGEREVLSGEVAFTLHDTYGFPVDLTREVCESRGKRLDMDAFAQAMEAQRERARASANRDAWGSYNNAWTLLADEIRATEFCGYDHDRIEGARVLAIVGDGERLGVAQQGAKVEIVLDRTPFYAEMGGQVGDTGELVAPGVRVVVSDTLSREGGLFSHVSLVEEGVVRVGDVLEAGIDVGRRQLIRRNHTATHLLDAALKQVLGEHVSQAGSLVMPERLRFDFTHFEALTSEELQRVEGLVNAEVFAAEPMVTQVMGIDEARASGAVALFGEKYGDVVRVVSTGDSNKPFSRELCGGTHAANTAEVGLFKIVSEGSVGANTRRIEAVTSAGAIAYVDERLALLDGVSAILKCRPADVGARVEQLQGEVHESLKKLKEALTGGSSSAISGAIDQALNMGNYKLVVAKLEGMGANDLRGVWDTVRDRLGVASACVLASTTADGKVALLAAATDAAVKAGFAAGNVIREIASLVGGRGGGRPTMAQAGGRDASGIDEALQAAKTFLGA